MNLETFTKFYNDLVKFNDSIPILVTHNGKHLIYRQRSYICFLPYLDNYYIPGKLKLGVLMPDDLYDLKVSIQRIIQDPRLTKGDLNTSLKKFRTEVYSLESGLPGPQLIYEFDYCSITSKFLSKIILKHSGTESKLLLKSFLYENKSNKSIKVSSTTQV